MNSINSDYIYSIYALWQDLNQVFLDNVEENKQIHTSYSSPTTRSCIDWLQELGEAIKRNDRKKIDHFLNKIMFQSGQAIGAHNKYSSQGIEFGSEEWMKPYFELSQIAIILTSKINPSGLIK